MVGAAAAAAGGKSGSCLDAAAAAATDAVLCHELVGRTPLGLTHHCIYTVQFHQG